MTEILKLALSGFWEFVGVAIILNGFMHFTVNLINRMWTRFTRMLMVRKQGWPPSHLDADGDWKPIEKQ